MKHCLRIVIVLLNFSLCQSQSCCKSNQLRKLLSGFDAFVGFFRGQYSECTACDAQTYFERNYNACPLKHQLGPTNNQVCQKCPFFTIPNSMAASNYEIVNDDGPYAGTDLGIRCFTRCFDAYQTMKQNVYVKNDYEIYEDMVDDGLLSDDELKEIKQVQLFESSAVCQTVSQLSNFHFTKNGEKECKSGTQYCNVGKFHLPATMQCKQCPLGFTRTLTEQKHEHEYPKALDARKTSLTDMYGVKTGLQIWTSTKFVDAFQTPFQFPWIDWQYWEICTPCPEGTRQISYGDAANEQKMLPDDVLMDSAAFNIDQTVWNWCNFRCQACSWQDGYQSKTGQTTCDTCEFPHIQVYTKVDIEFYNFFADFASNPVDAFSFGNGHKYYTEILESKRVKFSANLGTKCTLCAPGFQHFQSHYEFDREMTGLPTLCRQAETATQEGAFYHCCKPCDVNKVYESGRCIAVTKPTNKPFMNTKDDIIETCPANEQIMHCEPADFLLHKEQDINKPENFALSTQPLQNPCSSNSANRAVVNQFSATASPWITCVQCAHVESYNTKEKSCEACKSQYQHKTFDCKLNCVSFDQFQASYPPFTIEKIAFLYHDSVNLEQHAETGLFGEYRDETNKCSICSSCHYMHLDYSLTNFETIEDEKEDGKYQQILKSYFSTPDIIVHFASERMGYRNAIIYEDAQRSPRFGFRKLKASCLPIPEKKLQWISAQKSYSADETSLWPDQNYADLVTFTGDNYYKSIYAALNSEHKLYALKPMKQYFVNYKTVVDNQISCQVRHCSHICNGVTIEEQANYPILKQIALNKNVYEYARGCSPSTVYDIIMKKQDDEITLSPLIDILKESTSEAELESWTLLQSGECVRCAECSSGQYNQFCNKYGYTHASTGELITPAGKCETCDTTCAANEWIYHSIRYAGCERFTVSGVFDNVYNYQCKQCPKLIFIDPERAATISSLHPNSLPQYAGLYVVAGCGNLNSYDHFSTSPETGSHYFQASTILDDALDEQTREFKTFLPFYKLLPVCPPLFWYDSEADGCGLDQQTSQTIDGLKMYFNDYAGFTTTEAKCCKECNTCGLGDGLKRDLRNYRQCSGSTIIDTQAFCVARCATGSFQNDNDECEQCQLCGGDAFS